MSKELEMGPQCHIAILLVIFLGIWRYVGVDLGTPT